MSWPLPMGLGGGMHTAAGRGTVGAVTHAFSLPLTDHLDTSGVFLIRHEPALLRLSRDI